MYLIKDYYPKYKRTYKTKQEENEQPRLKKQMDKKPEQTPY
jgi:hypothetical protein